MSGFSPQGAGVGSGVFPGAQYDRVDGVPGENTYHVRGTRGSDGCPNDDWSIPTLDEINALQQANNCILTEGNTVPLPVECAIDDPCILYNKLIELFSVCSVPLATQGEIDAIDPDVDTVLVCTTNGPRLVPISQLGSGGSGGFGSPCDDGVPIGTIETISGGQSSVTAGDDVSQKISDFLGLGGTWIALNTCNSGTEGDCPLTAQKTAC